MVKVAETKDTTLTLRIRPSIKRMALERSREVDRSLASYLENLVKADYELAKDAKRGR